MTKSQELKKKAVELFTKKYTHHYYRVFSDMRGRPDVETLITEWKGNMKKIQTFWLSQLDLICSEVVGETIRKIDKLVQHPPNVGGGDIVCIDLDDWDKLITHLKSK